MQPRKLKYELESAVVNHILNVLDKVQVSGIQAQRMNVQITELLQSPANKEDMEKEQLETLKEKFEKKDKK